MTSPRNWTIDQAAAKACNGRVPSFVVTHADRVWFERCHRAWDLGAGECRRLEPFDPTIKTGSWDRWAATPAVRDALAIHYFPGMWAWSRSIVDPLVMAAADRAHATAAERAVVEAFLGWAPDLDDFTPVRVEPDVDAVVPDPVIPNQDLSTEDGTGVHYQERIPMVVLDDADDRTWLVVHHLVDEWSEPDAFALDERSLTAAWAWQHQELSPPVAGVVHDELRLDPPSFRRHRVELMPGQAAAAGARLGRTVLDMLDPVLRTDPTFDWAHCRLCSFRSPCLAMERGSEVVDLLAEQYRRRPERPLEEGRVGGSTWSQSRGARPPRFDTP